MKKPKKPETKAEIPQQQIEELVKRRNSEKGAAEKQKLNAEITRLFGRNLLRVCNSPDSVPLSR